jgi:hypothetical protein
MEINGSNLGHIFAPMPPNFGFAARFESFWPSSLPLPDPNRLTHAKKAT